MTEAALYIKGEVRFRIKPSQYLAPPQNFCVTPDVETLWTRYEGYLRGREPLLPMAYFCLTVIEAAYNGRANAAKHLNVAEAFLDRIGKLASTKGDSLTARKIDVLSTKRSLSGLETTWLQEALPALIRRLGEAHSPIPSKRLDMKDFPPLDP